MPTGARRTRGVDAAHSRPTPPGCRRPGATRRHGTTTGAAPLAPAAATRLPLIALLGANTIALVGNQLTFIAVPWFILQTMGSPARAGLAAACAALTGALAAFFGGPLVDRWGSRRTSVAADRAGGLAVGLIPLLHGTIGLAFWQLVLLIVAGVLLDAPGAAAREALLPDLAARAGLRLERVNAVAQALWRVAGLLGPVLAGLLLVGLGSGAALALDAASFAISAAVLAVAVPPRRRAGAPVAPPWPSGGRAYLAGLWAGLDYLRHDRVVLTLVLSFTALNALGEPLFALVLPVYARQGRGDAADLGLLLAAFALLFAPPLPVLLGALALRGAAGGPLNPLAVTVSQERIPAHLRAGLRRGPGARPRRTAAAGAGSALKGWSGWLAG